MGTRWGSTSAPRWVQKSKTYNISLWKCSGVEESDGKLHDKMLYLQPVNRYSSVRHPRIPCTTKNTSIHKKEAYTSSSPWKWLIHNSDNKNCWFPPLLAAVCPHMCVCVCLRVCSHDRQRHLVDTGAVQCQGKIVSDFKKNGLTSYA